MLCYAMLCYVCFSDSVQFVIMAEAKNHRQDLSDGELSDDDGGEDLDTSVCKTCNLTFTNSKVSNLLVHNVH